MPDKTTAKKRCAKKRPSVWREEAHPALTHSIIAIGAFFAGVLVLGGLAVNAEADASSSPTVLEAINDLRINLNLLARRVETVEEYIKSEQEAEPKIASTCEALQAALPVVSSMRRVPSSIACFNAPGISMPDKKFLSISALYQYTDVRDDAKELTLQIYDLNSDAKAVEYFLSKGAYLPVDYDRVKREVANINGTLGVFTYEGIPFDQTRYERGAYWFVINGRFGVLAHGTPVGFTDRDKLDELIRALDADALLKIE
jgi:hypothetical protein